MLHVYIYIYTSVDIYIYMLSENKECLPLHIRGGCPWPARHICKCGYRIHIMIIYIPPNQITCTSTCISGYQFPTNLFMRGVFKFAFRNLFWTIHEGPKLAPFDSLYPHVSTPGTKHRWVSPDMFSFREDFKCLNLTWMGINSFSAWEVGVFNDFTKWSREKSSNWDSPEKKK